MVKDFRNNLPKKIIDNETQANELAKILADAAIKKFKNPQGAKTPYQRKYKKA